MDIRAAILAAALALGAVFALRPEGLQAARHARVVEIQLIWSTMGLGLEARAQGPTLIIKYPSSGLGAAVAHGYLLSERDRELGFTAVVTERY